MNKITNNKIKTEIKVQKYSIIHYKYMITAVDINEGFYNFRHQ